MRIYTVHLRRPLMDPSRDVVLVKEGFSWWAFLFTLLWALWNGLWLVAACVFAVEVVLSAAMAAIGVGPIGELVVTLGFNLIFAYVAHDLKRWTLSRRGFLDGGVVSGETALAAERRFYEYHPMAVRDLTA